MRYKPLVSVIIPTYCRPKLFKIALDSVLNQTYKNIEIFITDNSPDEDTKFIMQSYLKKYNNIIYEHHPEYKGALENWNRAIAYDNPKAEYVNWLMDDDVFMPNKIEVMVGKFLKYNNLALVTSYRQAIDINGNILPDMPCNKRISECDNMYSGEGIGKTLLFNINNFVGEPTTVLIKKKCISCGQIGGVSLLDNGDFISDFPTWLDCLRNGDLYYVSEPLSQFRIHLGQEQNNMDIYSLGILCWGREVLYAYENKTYLKNKDDFMKSSYIWLKTLEIYINKCERVSYNNEDMIKQVADITNKISVIRSSFI